MTLGTCGLTREDRALLADLAFWAAEGKPLDGPEIRAGQKLESLGLCTLEYERLWVGAYGHYVSVAVLTAAGWRLVHGPRLAAFAGEALDFDTPLPWSLARTLAQRLYRAAGGLQEARSPAGATGTQRGAHFTPDDCA